MHNSFVKGWYHDSHRHPVDSKCWGDWMTTQHAQNVDLYHRLFELGDIWGVSHQEIKQAVSNLWDSFFTNIDSCGDYKIVYDYYQWCGDNLGKCMYMDGIDDRIIKNALPLLSDLTAMVNELSIDEDCASDKESLR